MFTIRICTNEGLVYTLSGGNLTLSDDNGNEFTEWIDSMRPLVVGKTCVINTLPSATYPRGCSHHIDVASMEVHPYENGAIDTCTYEKVYEDDAHTCTVHSAS